MGCCYSRRQKEKTIARSQPITVDTATLDNVDRYVPPLHTGRVLKVYDGDTITVATEINNIVYKVNIRLSGIDAPEMRAKSTHEKQKAILARDELARLVTGQHVTLSNIQIDKYGGRFVASVGVYINNRLVDCSEHMLASGMARPYDGKTKDPW